MANHLLVTLERIADALERIADAVESGEAFTHAEPGQGTDVRTMMLAKFAGQLVTIEEAREALGGNWQEASAKAIGQALSGAGFKRRRWSTGVKYAVAADGSQDATGAPIQMPPKLAESVKQAIEATARDGRRRTALNVIQGAYILGDGVAKNNQATPQHIAEVHRLYPGMFD